MPFYIKREKAEYGVGVGAYLKSEYKQKREKKN